MDQQSSPFTFVISEAAKTQMKMLVSAEYEGAKKKAQHGMLYGGGPGEFEKIDWAKGHKPIMIDFTKKSSAVVTVDKNLLISFIDPKIPAGETTITLNIRLIHDNTNNVYSIVWGGGASASDPTFSQFTSQLKWGKSGKLNTLSGAKTVRLVHLIYALNQQGYEADWTPWKLVSFDTETLHDQVKAAFKSDKDDLMALKKAQDQLEAEQLQQYDEQAKAKAKAKKAVEHYEGVIAKLSAQAEKAAYDAMQLSQKSNPVASKKQPIDEAMQNLDHKVNNVYDDLVAQWKTKHSSDAFMLKAYEMYAQDCIKANKNIGLSFDMWKEQYTKALFSLDKQQVLKYIYGKGFKEPALGVKGFKEPVFEGKITKLKINDVSAEELQEKLVGSLKAVADQKLQEAKGLDIKDVTAEEIVAKAEPTATKAYQVKNVADKLKIEGAVVDKDAQAEANQKLAGWEKQPEPEPQPTEAEVTSELCAEAKSAIKDLFKVEVRLAPYGDMYKVFFHTKIPSHVDATLLPIVSLSRHFGQCWYRIDKMHEHDHHTSSYSPEDLKPYVLRVLRDIRDKMLAANLVTKDEVQDLDAIEFGDIGKG